MNLNDESRRRFLACFSSLGLGGTLLPGVLWAQAQEENTQRITMEMLRGALAISGLSFSDEDQKSMLQAVNRSLTTYEDLRKLEIPNDVAPPFYFSALVPGMKVSRTREPLRFSAHSNKRPANVEDLAFAPLTQLAHLLKTRQVTSTELTTMYLARLHKHNDKLNCVVTFLDDLALSQAKQADAEIRAGHYKGPLHGIPWGAKDIIAVPGYKTTWGSGAYKDQVLAEEASVVTMLRNSGAVLLAKLTSGELAQGDRWFGGMTRNPWNPEEGSSGSSAGPASATAAGLVGFSIGSETSGSILSPSARCGVTGLRPTFGRVSRYGVMALSWTQDRLGPLCRYAEDCAVVMSAIARPDDRDLSVVDLPFNWSARKDIRKLRVGYLEGAFEETRDPIAKHNDENALERIRSLVGKLVPVKVPEWNIEVSSIGVESGVFFDQLIRSGQDKQMTNPGRANGFRSSRLVPAVEYLQSQRARTMMMMKLAEATAGIDVYLVPANSGGGGPRPPATATDGAARPTGSDGGRPPAATDGAPPRTPGGGFGGQRRSIVSRHFNMANLAGYPAVNVVNGFTDKNTPTNITIYARPFLDGEVLAVAKAYQDAAGFYKKRPPLFS